MSDKTLSTNVLALSRLIRGLDDGTIDAKKQIKGLFKYSGDAHVIGITGSPGSGKSTIISALISKFRKEGKTVGVVAVDPTSPFSGGAILGDRIRMKEHNSDEGVFIKSVATRGSFGGLSSSVMDIVLALESSGKDIVIIETVGVGQDEVDVSKIAEAVIVVTAPGFGDDIQAIKAGVLEIADMFVVNKCDLNGADKTALELKETSEKKVLLTDAIRGTGIDLFYDEIKKRISLFEDKKNKLEYLKKRYKFEIELKLRDKLMALLGEAFKKNKEFKDVLKKVEQRKCDPSTAIDELINRMKII